MVEISYFRDKFSIVSSLPLFSSLSLFQKRFIASRCEIIEFKKGQIIYREGDPPDYFYCVVNGRIDIYHPPAKGKRRDKQKIECVRRGDYFGSISSLTGKPHTVSARALNDSALLRVNTKNFDEILRKIPKLAIFLSHSLSRRLGQKHRKEIFESKIIGIYGVSHKIDSSKYTKDLAEGLRRESGKRVLIAKSQAMLNKKNVSSKLSAFTEDYHYILINVARELNDVNFEILKQSDICHVVSPPDNASLKKASSITKELDKAFGSYARQTVSIILPKKKALYKEMIRRMAREISGVRIGLVLSSGAAMGLAHIGVLKVIEKEEIPIDIIAATSMGALVGALWAVGYKAGEIEKLAYSFKSKLKTLSLIDPTLPIRGLIKGRAIRRILKSYFKNLTFSDTLLPLKIVTCDIRNRREFIIDKGRLADAVMASIAIPGVFEPIEYKGLRLVDGGIVNPAPVSVLSKLGIKRIVAVNTLPSPEDMVRMRRKRLNIYDIIVNSFQSMEYTMALHSCQQADVYLHPIPKFADWYEFYKAEVFINTGLNHTRRELAQIKKLCTTKIR